MVLDPGLPEPPFLAGAGAVFLVRLQLRLRLLLLLTGRVAGAARSRPFWLEPEPFFGPAPTPTLNILFLRDPTYDYDDYDYDYDDFDYDDYDDYD